MRLPAVFWRWQPVQHGGDVRRGLRGPSREVICWSAESPGYGLGVQLRILSPCWAFCDRLRCSMDHVGCPLVWMGLTTVAAIWIQGRRLQFQRYQLGCEPIECPPCYVFYFAEYLANGPHPIAQHALLLRLVGGGRGIRATRLTALAWSRALLVSAVYVRLNPGLLACMQERHAFTDSSPSDHRHVIACP